MKNFCICTILVLFLLPTLLFAGEAYYVDPSQTDPYENGSYEHPWNSINDVNDHRFNNGDDVYFKVNTKIVTSEKLDIDWDGLESDRVIIGAYYGEDKFGLNGNARPIIDGNYKVPDNTDTGLINYWSGTGYITVVDLALHNSHGYGINMSHEYSPNNLHTDYNIVKNCYVQNSYNQGILFARASYGLIEGCEVFRSSYNNGRDKAGIEITGMSSELVSLNNVVRGNVVRWAGEGIGSYKGARYTIIENNIVYDCKSYHIYFGNARNCIIRNNIIYETGPANQPPDDSTGPSDRLIAVDCEGHVSSIIKVLGYAQIYGNYIAGGYTGISLHSNANDVGVYQNNVEIYNNTIVDCAKNFEFLNVDPKWNNIKIYNNYSFIFDELSENLIHVNNPSPDGVEWSDNFWNLPVSGNAAHNENTTDVSLIKVSGWRSLEAGEVGISSFSFTGDVKTQPASSVTKVSNVRIFSES
jgi:parallel beta-helix repeat protein